MKDKLEQESEIEYETFIPTIRKQSEEFIIPLSTKPFKIYFRTKNRRIKKKQVKKSSFLKTYLYFKNMNGISNIARGVIAPVLPTWHIISFTIVSFFSGGYLYAIAHLGTLNVVPKNSLCSKLSTFTTAPSIPKLKNSLSSPILLIAFITSSILLHKILTGLTLNPSFSIYSNDS